MNYSVFIPFLAARVALSMGNTMLSVAVGWHLYELSGDPFDLALVGLVQIIPLLALFVFSGWVVDNLSRRLVLVVCAGVEIFVLLGIALVMNSGFEPQEKLAVFALLFFHGCCRAFLGPAQQAILPNIVSREHLSRAVAITSSAWNAAMMAGPFVAGLLLAQVDLDIYWTLAGLYLLGALAFLRLPRLTQLKPSGKGLQQLLGGIHFIRGNPYVLGSISLDLLVVLFGGVMALLPVYAMDILEVGPEALGLLRGMPALGAVMVGVAMSSLPEVTHVGRTLFAALLLFSLSILVFAFSTSLWLSLAALWLYGASDMISVNIRGTLLQLATPDELRGRVSAVNSLFIASSNEMGDFRAGSMAAVLPPVVAVALGGFMALGITVMGGRLFPQIRRLSRYSAIEGANL